MYCVLSLLLRALPKYPSNPPLVALPVSLTSQLVGISFSPACSAPAPTKRETRTSAHMSSFFPRSPLVVFIVESLLKLGARLRVKPRGRQRSQQSRGQDRERRDGARCRAQPATHVVETERLVTARG